VIVTVLLFACDIPPTSLATKVYTIDVGVAPTFNVFGTTDVIVMLESTVVYAPFTLAVSVDVTIPIA